jgi:ubiquitin-activating enzyme E1
LWCGLSRQARENVEKAAECLLTSRCATYDECVAWARLRFQDSFHDKIAQLTYTFPEDATTSTASPFWSAPKRFPHALDFSTADAANLELMRAMANLKAGRCTAVECTAVESTA